MGAQQDPQGIKPALTRWGCTTYVASMLDDPDDIHPLFHGAPRTTEFKKLRKRIIRETREAIDRYGMIERDTRWLVCLSGGKCSADGSLCSFNPADSK